MAECPGLKSGSVKATAKANQPNQPKPKLLREARPKRFLHKNNDEKA